MGVGAGEASAYRQECSRNGRCAGASVARERADLKATIAADWRGGKLTRRRGSDGQGARNACHLARLGTTLNVGCKGGSVGCALHTSRYIAFTPPRRLAHRTRPRLPRV